MRQPRPAAGWVLALAVAAACNAPISTIRSPYHLRVVEVRNASEEPRTLTIEPSADQHLGAATTFTGHMEPGEVKVLYLYHGFEYHFRVLDRPTGEGLADAIVRVDRDMGLNFSGDSLTADAIGIQIRLGEPTFADSLMALDPFGLRGREDALMPDTTRGQGVPIDSDERRERERERELERLRGRIP